MFEMAVFTSSISLIFSTFWIRECKKKKVVFIPCSPRREFVRICASFRINKDLKRKCTRLLKFGERCLRWRYLLHRSRLSFLHFGFENVKKKSCLHPTLSKKRIRTYLYREWNDTIKEHVGVSRNWRLKLIFLREIKKNCTRKIIKISFQISCIIFHRKRTKKFIKHMHMYIYACTYKHNNTKRENYTWCSKRLHGIVFLQVVSQRGLIKLKWILTPFWLKKGTVACNTPCDARKEVAS